MLLLLLSTSDRNLAKFILNEEMSTSPEVWAVNVSRHLLGENEDVVYMEDVHSEPRELSVVDCGWHTIPSR